MHGTSAVAPPRGPSHPEAERLSTKAAAQAAVSKQTDPYTFTNCQQPPA